MYETNKLAAASIRQQAYFTRSFLEVSSIFCADWPINKAAASHLDYIDFVTRPFHKPAFDIDSVIVDGCEVPVVEEVVLQKAFCNLLSFKRIATDKVEDKILIVAPMSGHFSTLVKETVQRMLEHYDVYVTDWIDAAQVPTDSGRFDLDDYVDYCRDFMQLLGPDLHVFAVCQPGPPVLAAIALMSEDEDACVPKSMVLFGCPIDPRINATEPYKFSQQNSLQLLEQTVVHQVPQTLPGAGRSVYPGFLQLSSFLSMNLGRHCQSYADYYQNLLSQNFSESDSHEDFYSNYNAVMDMTAEFYLQTIDRVFKKAEIATNTMTHRGRLVKPALITKTRLMTIEGEKDDITGQGQTLAAHDLCTRLSAVDRHHHLQHGAGHYGIFSGRRWKNEIAPEIIKFIEAGSSM